jgi:hypothetical protein
MGAIAGLAKEVEHLATNVRRIAMMADTHRPGRLSPTQDRFFLDDLCKATCRHFPG